MENADWLIIAEGIMEQPIKVEPCSFKFELSDEISECEDVFRLDEMVKGIDKATEDYCSLLERLCERSNHINSVHRMENTMKEIFSKHKHNAIFNNGNDLQELQDKYWDLYGGYLKTLIEYRYAMIGFDPKVWIKY